MVRRTEKKLSEMTRKSHTGIQSAEARAEELAGELFHRPGSLLTSDEITHLWQESGCEELREEPDCNFPTVNLFRTIDGTCNNLMNPLFGASATPFPRLIPAEYEDGISSLRGGLQARNEGLLGITPFVPPNPSPRTVSLNIVRNVTQDELPFTHILMQWGQFLDHDLDLSPELEAECEGCTFTEVCEPIRVEDIDPAFGVGTSQNGDCLRFSRSLPTCDISPPGSFNPREQSNDLTSFIDGSMVYGSNEVVGNAVREFRDGLLREGPPFPGNQPSLPVDDQSIVACPNQQNCFLAGDVRVNEQISLTIMHTIWLREHNRLARALAQLNPRWDDERLFQEARKIVGAMIQKITYVDYLPKVLGPEVFNQVIGPFFEYDPRVNPGVPNSFATAAYRYGHSLIRPFFDRLGPSFRPLSIGPLNLVNAFFNPDQFRSSVGTDPILRGLVSLNSRRVDEFLNSVLTTRLFETDISPGMDLAALNMQRGRDHGLPPYVIWRNFCSRVFSLTSDIENSLTLVRFLQNYGSLDTVDLWVGGLAEDRLPNSLLGATFACIFGITFSNVRNGDRFFYLRPGVFTSSQRRQVEMATLSRVICDNSDGIESIQPDAFLSNQTRVSCDSLPRVSLEAWREDVCYFRARVSPRSFNLPILVFSRVTTQEYIFNEVSVTASTVDQFECVPVTCPTTRVPVDVITYSSTSLLNVLQITSNSVLPRSSLAFSGGYRAFWPRSLFGSSGLFTSLSQCQRAGAVSALTFTIPSAQNIEVEASLLANVAQDDDDSKSDDVPEAILEILKEENPNAEVESIESKASPAGASVAEKSDEALLQDLEDALRTLSEN